MKLHLQQPIVIERMPSYEEAMVWTWEATLWIVIDEVTGPDAFDGFITKILPFGDLLQLEELQPFLSVICAVEGDHFIIEQRRV